MDQAPPVAPAKKITRAKKIRAEKKDAEMKDMARKFTSKDKGRPAYQTNRPAPKKIKKERQSSKKSTKSLTSRRVSIHVPK